MGSTWKVEDASRGPESQDGYVRSEAQEGRGNKKCSMVQRNGGRAGDGLEIRNPNEEGTRRQNFHVHSASVSHVA